MLITLKLRSLNPVDKSCSYPQGKLSTAYDRSYSDLIQHLLCVEFSTILVENFVWRVNENSNDCGYG